MNTISESKTPEQNRLEGFVLNAVFLGVPIVGLAHEELFYDAGLSFSEKFARWHSQPAVSAHLARTVILLSVLAVGVVSFR